MSPKDVELLILLKKEKKSKKEICSEECLKKMANVMMYSYPLSLQLRRSFVDINSEFK